MAKGIPRTKHTYKEWLNGGGEMGELIRCFNWSKTSIGPRENWSPALRMMTSFLVANRFPMLLWWGPEFCQIYNDAYRPVLGIKHPKAALGKPFKQCWKEVYHLLGPLAQTPFRGGPPTWMEDILCEVNRYGFVEETHFTIAYSPVPDETAPGGIGGVLATVHEISAKVVAERRVAILRDLGARSVEGKTPTEACVIAADALASHDKDIPFALIYLIDPTKKYASLAAACGLDIMRETNLSKIGLELPEHDAWSLSRIFKTREMQLISNLGDIFQQVPKGPWADAPNQAVVVPIRSSMATELAGFMVAGISARLCFDEQYRSFIELVSAQISMAVANARAYDEERRRAEALAEIDRAKTAFFSNVSHEFRTPLTLLLGPSQEALAHTTDSKQHENLRIIHRNALRLQKLVNTLLDFSRIEAGRTDVSYEPTGLASFTMELANLFRPTIERAGLEFAVDCEPLSELAYVDRDMWEKIVLNLLSNAFKFTLSGKIELKLMQAGGLVEFSIADTGTGIPAHELPRVFERFHRIQGVHGRTHEGSGIGLALVHELVKLHGAKITVTSVEGKGSTFTITMPLGHEHLPADRVRGRRQLSATPLGATPFVEEALRWLPNQDFGMEEQITLPFQTSRKAKILLADDNADMRAYISRLLSPYYSVETCSNGKEALERVMERCFDLVLTDVMMPHLDGFQFLRKIRNNPQTAVIPIILLSARAGEEAVIEGIQAGADDYIIKPFSAKELLVRVNSRLEMARQRQENFDRCSNPQPEFQK